MTTTKDKDASMNEDVAALIRRRTYELGEPLETLRARAVEAGHDLSRTTLWKIGRKPVVQFPERATMHAVAAVLDVDFPTVVRAIACSIVAVPTPVPAAVAELVQMCVGRPEHEVAGLQRIAREFLRMQDHPS